MKKIFSSILVLGLLLSGNAYADCFDDIDFSTEWFDVKHPYQNFTFKNKSKKTIEITKYGIYAKGSKDIVIE